RLSRLPAGNQFRLFLVRSESQQWPRAGSQRDRFSLQHRCRRLWSHGHWDRDRSWLDYESTRGGTRSDHVEYVLIRSPRRRDFRDHWLQRLVLSFPRHEHRAASWQLGTVVDRYHSAACGGFVRKEIFRWDE